MKIFIATKNQKKLKELKRIFDEIENICDSD